jgi:hypothetical protein
MKINVGRPLVKMSAYWDVVGSRHMKNMYGFGRNLDTSKVQINLNVLGALMLHLIRREIKKHLHCHNRQGWLDKEDNGALLEAGIAM